MTFGQKLKEIRKRFGLSQERFASLLNVSRQAITKWENDMGVPDISNLQELSKVFGVSVDSLLDDKDKLPVLSIRKEFDKKKYNNKTSVLKEYFDDTYDIYILSRRKDMGVLERVLDFFTYGIHDDIDGLSDMSLYYLVKKGSFKYLVNIKNWVLEIIVLPSSINDKRFVCNGNKFINCGKVKV